MDGFHPTLRKEIVFGRMITVLYCSYNESIFDRIINIEHKLLLLKCHRISTKQINIVQAINRLIQNL